MNKRVILNVTLFLLGFAFAASWFHYGADKQQSPQATSNKSDLPVYETQLNLALKSQEQENYRNIIKNKEAQIATLKSQLAQLSDEQHPLTNRLSNKIPSDSAINNDKKNDPLLKKMSMQDFEESMKDSFVNRFKGVVLELSGNELEAVKKSYSNSTDRNDWSNNYENSIASFLAENDLNGDHFVQTINCNTQVCKLEINTNNDETWSRLYASMTLQPWYKTITVEENSDYPGNHIYYLPSIEN